MAITKIHPIRRTLAKAVRYITDPDKTEEQLLVSTFGCSSGTVVAEFAMTAGLGTERGNTLAQHMIQSFKPGEVTPEEAHRIGRELVDRLTDHKHEYIITTHVDRNHIHNHIIFNQTSFVDYKKFRSNKQTVRRMRALSDEICKEHGLNVIEKPQGAFHSYYEWQKRREDKSYKKKLEAAIDKCINWSNTYDQFLQNMKMLGYEIKLGKYIAFRASDQERFTRAKTLGPDYTEERIRERIEKHEPTIRGSYHRHPFEYEGIGLIVLVENHIKCMENPAYRQKVMVANVKKLAATYNYLKDHGIDSVEALSEREKQLRTEVASTRESIRGIESQLGEIIEQQKYFSRISQYKPLWNEYVKTGKSPKFREEHRAELMLYEAAIKAIKVSGTSTDFADAGKIAQANMESLEKEKASLMERLDALKQEQKDLIQVRKNVEIVLNAGEEKEKKKDRERE